MSRSFVQLAKLFEPKTQNLVASPKDSFSILLPEKALSPTDFILSRSNSTKPEFLKALARTLRTLEKKSAERMPERLVQFSKAHSGTSCSSRVK